MVRTRIAPSPTGYPHIGTMYQALFDFAFAKKYHGKFVVRIEDTDRTRFVADAEEKLYAALDWFGLTEQESPRKNGPFGPYKQSDRLALYKKYADELIEKKHAYYCFCTKERMDEVRKQQQAAGKIPMYDKHCKLLTREEIEKNLAESMPHVVRMVIPENKTIVVHDEIRGDISFDSNLVDDQVILKSDSFPTYHLAVVVDDHLMEITHLVRAEEWISSTPKHFLLYEYLNWERPLFFHTSLLRNADKSKLSKRHGHTSVSWYHENGYLPEAILNFLALLGWSHPEEKEIFTLDEFISLFELKDIKSVAPTFDLTKLNWMNQQYIQHLPEDSLLDRLHAFYPDYANNQLVKQLLPLVRERMQTLRDFDELTKHFFVEPEISVTNDTEKEVVTTLITKLGSVSDWTKENIFAEFKTVMDTYKVRMPLLYRLLTGKERGLPLPESLVILGKDVTLSRLTRMVS